MGAHLVCYDCGVYLQNNVYTWPACHRLKGFNNLSDDSALIDCCAMCYDIREDEYKRQGGRMLPYNVVVKDRPKSNAEIADETFKSLRAMRQMSDVEWEAWSLEAGTKSPSGNNYVLPAPMQSYAKEEK